MDLLLLFIFNKRLFHFLFWADCFYGLLEESDILKELVFSGCPAWDSAYAGLPLLPGWTEIKRNPNSLRLR